MPRYVATLVREVRKLSSAVVAVEATDITEAYQLAATTRPLAWEPLDVEKSIEVEQVVLEEASWLVVP